MSNPNQNQNQNHKFNIIIDPHDGAQNKKIKIIIISTGGTIEKSYDENDGQLINRFSVVEDRVLERLRLPYTEVDVRPILAKDSLFMDEHDREVLSKAILQFMEEGHPIVVLHGTDTMDKTLRYCVDHIQNPKVAIIFTGAMRPLEFEDTDGIQNIIEAMMGCKLLAPGLYLSFHNRIFSGASFKKDRKHLTFEGV
ncbi:MAG: asparaginase [Oligoflexia bacterium]|nr:asparaginase [Oligoflexia bacterium]